MHCYFNKVVRSLASDKEKIFLTFVKFEQLRGGKKVLLHHKKFLMRNIFLSHPAAIHKAYYECIFASRRTVDFFFYFVTDQNFMDAYPSTQNIDIVFVLMCYHCIDLS